MSFRKTKIIATLGPATSDYKSIKDIVLSGANGLRINCSHGNEKENQQKINIVKQLRQELNISLPLILDTRGPEIRVGNFKNGSVFLKKGNIFTFVSEEIEGNETCVSLLQPQIMKNVKINNTILACNGLIQFKVIEKKNDALICKIKNNGTISNHKSLFFPNVEYNVPYLNELDKSDILWGIKNKIEYIAASFVNSKSDIDTLRKFISDNNGNMDIIAKIESKIGIKNIDEIIDSADAIMVARGDLGVEIPHEKLPELQKIIIKKSHKAGKMVVTATEMLESMISSPRPTRAETSDVANAVYDGTSIVMLSGETAIGRYPTLAVSTMAKIALETEKSIHYKKRYTSNELNSSNIIDVMSDAVVHISYELKDVKAICVYTDSGHTAKMISRFNPIVPIIAFTPIEKTYNTLSLIWGVIPILTKPCESADQLLKTVNDKIKALKLAKPNEMILIGTGSRKPTSTDMIKIHIIN